MHHGQVIRPEFLPREIWGEGPRKEAPYAFEIPPEGILLEEIIEQIERDLVEKAVRITGGNVAKTARLLSVPRGTLRYKMEKYGLAES
jgi:two-component system, NtrC family, response regulator AtoC